MQIKFTQQAQHAISNAEKAAKKLNHPPRQCIVNIFPFFAVPKEAK